MPVGDMASLIMFRYLRVNVLGQLAAALIRQLYPTFPAYPPDWAVFAGLATALVTGILFGVLPARRAAQLDPVQALSKR